MDRVVEMISDPSFLISAVAIILIPIWWNVTARLEYHTQVLSRLWCGNRLLAAYSLALAIFVVSNVRTWLFQRAMTGAPQGVAIVCGGAAVDVLAYVILVVGAALVLGSYYRLGILGTYLGDYFGFLFSERVTGFPYNILDDPMYTGSTLLYIGDALLLRSVTGTVLAGLVAAVYYVAATRFEGPFTSSIYAAAAKSKSRAAASKDKRS